MSTNVIKTEGLTVYYGAHRGIIDVDLAVQKGEAFGFLGPNGAGKTTTLRVLLDVIRPNRGTATIFGMDAQKEGVAIRKRIGYIPGELALHPTMKGRQYLNMMDAIRGQKSNADYRRQLIARFDLDISRRVKQYSRGNKQKLGLVAAMMHKPDLLILDEPTGGLDPLIQQAALETVREAKNEGRTVFFSSHILPEVQAVCDRVAIIREGRLVAVENVRDLLTRAFQRLRLSLEQPFPADFEFDGVKVVDQSENQITVEIKDNMPEFMQLAASHGILGVDSFEISLEEVFLAYYGKGNDHD